MDREFWLQRWQRHEIAFHQTQVNPRLERFWPLFGLAGGETTFVPLCGKSLDMAWLLGQGHPVLGVELSSHAIEQFFREQGIEPRQRLREPFVSYAAAGIELLAGDFFSLEPADLAGIGAVYDRASLISMPERMRDHYAERLATLIPPGVPTLLITLEYAPEEMNGPPFPVAEPEVQRLYGEAFNVTRLDVADVLAAHERFRQKGLTALHEKVYRLDRR